MTVFAFPRRSAPRLDRHRPGGGTTEADLRAVARFALGRPGWGVEEERSAADGPARLALRTPSAGPTGRPRWQVARAGDRLAVVNLAAGEAIGRFATMREALAAVWEVEARAVPPPD